MLRVARQRAFRRSAFVAPAQAAPESRSASSVLLEITDRLSATAAVVTLGSPSGVAVGWSQVTGNEGYRVEWDTVSHPTEETPYANSAETGTDVNTYTIVSVTPSTTYYWRVAALAGGSPPVVQNWSSEDSFVA